MAFGTERRLHQGRRTTEELDLARREWELRFYCWRWLVILIPATVQALVAVARLLAGEPPLLLPLVSDG